MKRLDKTKNVKKAEVIFLFVFYLVILASGLIYYIFYLDIDWLIKVIAGIFFVLLFLVWLRVPWLILGAVPGFMVIQNLYTINFEGYFYEISLAEVLIIAIVLFIILEQIFRKKIKLSLSIIGFYLLLYFVLMLVSGFWVERFSKYLITVRYFIFWFLSFLVVFNVLKEKKWLEIKRFLQIITLGMLLISLQLLWYAYLYGFFELADRPIFNTPVGPSVLVTAIIVFLMPLSLGFILIKGKVKFGVVKKIFHTLNLLIATTAAFFPLGKAEILGFLAGFIYLAKKISAQILIGLLALSGVVLVIFPKIFILLVQRFQNFFVDSTTIYRIREIEGFFEIFRTHPWLGVGAGNLKVYIQYYLPYRFLSDAAIFIENILGEQGILGLIIIILLVYSLIVILRRINSKIKTPEEKVMLLALKACLVVSVVNGLFEATFVNLFYGIIFWMIIGAIIAWYYQVVGSRL